MITKFKTIVAFATAALCISASVSLAQDEAGYDNSVTYASPDASVAADWMSGMVGMMPTPSLKDIAPNTVSSGVISADAKMIALQAMMVMNPFSLRQTISMMVAKKKVEEGISFDEVIESMDLRANFLNMKKVGHNTPWKVIEATTGEPTPRLEMINYCDIPTMRLIVDYVPEFSVFVPCRITVLEDANDDIWIMTLDWDIRWMDTSPNPNKISAELREAAIKVRESMESIMDAGASGDL